MRHIIIWDSSPEVPQAENSDREMSGKWLIEGDLSQETSSCTWKISSFVELSKSSESKNETVGILSTDTSFRKELESDGNPVQDKIPDLPNRFIILFVLDDADGELAMVARKTSEGIEIVSEDVPMIESSIDINLETLELRGIFPEFDRGDFYELDNGNVGAVVNYDIEDCSIDEFIVLIEFNKRYPAEPPRAWVLEPELDQSCPHIWQFDEHGHAQVDYINPDEWHLDYTSFDAAVMIKTWVYAYCNWEDHGEWTWDEGPSDRLNWT